MTTATIENRKVTMTIEEKARRLSVREINDHQLEVTSGSDATKKYTCEHNGRHVTRCSCAAYTSRCCHAIAGTWYLEAKNRDAYCDEFNIYS